MVHKTNVSKNTSEVNMHCVLMLSELMVMTLPNAQSGGCECQYHRISHSEGIKVIYSPRYIGGEKMILRYSTLKDLLASPHWTEAERQFALMTELSAGERAPKPYEIMVVVDNNSGFFYPAIRMEHVEHQMIYSCGFNNDKQNRIHKGRNSWINCLGKRFSLTDTHEGNIVWIPTKKRFMILDYGDVRDIREDHSKGQ